jgi:ubiquitin carboxyl-terminal hydrolase 4/11/15
MMNGDAEPPQRSSSPLKRRASSMDPDGALSKGESTIDADGSQSSQQLNASTAEFPRAMSIDAPDVNGHEASLSQRKITIKNDPEWLAPCLAYYNRTKPL